MSMTPEERRARNAEHNRRYYEAKKEELAEKRRRYREAKKEELAEKRRRYIEDNKEKVAEQKRRHLRRKKFTRENGSSFQAWLASLKNPNCIFATIANLQPDHGQTLAELIHELSGYAMDVCELIANPPVIEDSPELTPPAEPDLF